MEIEESHWPDRTEERESSTVNRKIGRGEYPTEKEGSKIFDEEKSHRGNKKSGEVFIKIHLSREKDDSASELLTKKS